MRQSGGDTHQAVGYNKVKFKDRVKDNRIGLWVITLIGSYVSQDFLLCFTVLHYSLKLLGR